MTSLNSGDIMHSPANRKLPQRRSRRNATSRRGARTSAVLFKKRGNIPNGSVPPYASISSRSRFTSRDLKAKVVRLGDGWRVNGKSTGSLDCFPSNYADSISAFPTNSQTRPKPVPIRGGRDESELEPNTADFRGDHHFWGHWAFMKTSRILTLI